MRDDAIDKELVVHHRLCVLVLALGALVAACGDDDADPSTADGGDQTTSTTAGDPDEPTDEGAEEPADGAAVSIEGFAFEPGSVEVPAGSTVTWTNEDSVGHTVSAGAPESPADGFDESVDGGGSAEVTFDEAGTFPYFCAIHPTMTGEVVVS